MTLSISVITPSYNQAEFIERTIDSVLNQKIAHLNYVVVDGASTDDTVKILKKYKNHLRYVSEPDRGQAHAVNKGIMMTDSQIIGWLNSDDIYYPGSLACVLEFFDKHPDIEIVYGKAKHIDRNDQFIELYPTEKWNVERLKQTCFISQPAVFFRRSLILRHGLLNEQLNYCMDYEYWLRVALAGAKFSYLEDILSGSRLHPTTKTLSAPDKALQETLHMLKKRVGIVPTSWLLHEAISTVKSKTSFRKPQLKFIVSTFALASVAAFRWNGLFAGSLACLGLPAKMWSVYKKKNFC